MTVTKSIADLGKATRFGQDWPGERCGAKTRRGTECQRPAYKRNGRCGLHGGKSTGARTPEGLQRIAAANLKYGSFTKEKMGAQRIRGEVGRKVLAEIKQIEAELMAAGLIDRKHDPV